MYYIYIYHIKKHYQRKNIKILFNKLILKYPLTLKQSIIFFFFIFNNFI